MCRVLVSGCFDVLHAGHVEFLERALAHGDHLTVSVGSDTTIHNLKGRWPALSQAERIRLLGALRCVDLAVPAPGEGMLDFESLLAAADVFVVNADGASTDKERLCKLYDVEYIVLDRTPTAGLPPRSSTELRGKHLPYRISLAGGWIDQPWVSQFHAGSMVVVSLEPTIDFDDRAGMATSTRRKILDVWPNAVERMPTDLAPERMARALFAVDNPPGTQHVSGSQDAIGLCYPGITRLYYEGGYWPTKVWNTLDPAVLDWFEHVVRLVPMHRRHSDFDPLDRMSLNAEWVKRLGEAGALCWSAINTRDLSSLKQSFHLTMECYRHMFPATVPYEGYGDGRMPTGAGGGGYLVSVDDIPPSDGEIAVRIRRS